MRPVALTGATGFLGRGIAAAFSARGRPVRALARDPAHLPKLPGLEACQGDLRDPAALDRLLDGAEGVVHCAGLVKARSRAEFFSVNADATQCLAEMAIQAGVARFLLISSLAAREPALSDYAASKAAAEEAVRSGAGSWTILRPPGIYGPGDDAVAPLLQLAQRGMFPALGPPDARVSLIHVDDCAEAVAAALLSPATVGRVYELDDGSGGYSWREVAEHAAKALGRPVRPIRVPGWVLDSIAWCSAGWGGLAGRPSFLSPGKARELQHPDWVARQGDLARDSDWCPRVSLEQGLRETCFPAHTES